MRYRIKAHFTSISQVTAEITQESYGYQGLHACRFTSFRTIIGKEINVQAKNSTRVALQLGVDKVVSLYHNKFS
jgi:hypothetical protein